MNHPDDRPALIGRFAVQRHALDDVEYQLGVAFSMDELAEIFDGVPDKPKAAEILKATVGMAWLNHPDQVIDR